MGTNLQGFRQNPHAAVMIRPLGFAVNEETAADNHFQAEGAEGDTARAVEEFDRFVEALTSAGLKVHAFDQARRDTPDAVFPNNWFSTHEDGLIVTYPMAVPSRRRERRPDILAALAEQYRVSEHFNLTEMENRGRILEGTGAVVFDHPLKLAFMARSLRAHEVVLQRLCEQIGYEAITFASVDRHKRSIYHTNVMMAVGENITLICEESIPDPEERKIVLDRLQVSDRKIVHLSQEQVENFSGNALEVDGMNGPVLVMSNRARSAFTPAQIGMIETRVPIVSAPLPTIEKSGGSARCMLAGVHLPRKDS